jgi:hypothetical protein
MHKFEIVQGIFRKTLGLMSRRARSSDFTCGDCERWERCGLPLHSDCIHRAAQIARGATRVKRVRLSVY